MEITKFIALALGGAAVSTAVLALITRPLVSLIRHALLPRPEAARNYTVSAVR